MADRTLLEHAVNAKATFCYSSTANSPDRHNGGLRLVPDVAGRGVLTANVEEMIAARMINGGVPDFRDVRTRLKNPEDRINR